MVHSYITYAIIPTEDKLANIINLAHSWLSETFNLLDH